MAAIYKFSGVADLQEFYGDLLIDYASHSVNNHLSLLAERLFEGYNDSNLVVIREINNYHPDWLGKGADQILGAQLQLSDIQLCIASEYGFKTWQAVMDVDQPYDEYFETALNALLEGEVQSLKVLLNAHPNLVNQKSNYGHGATLLHYTGSNGVEMWRQQVPMNLAEVTKTLLEAGADKSATMQVYSGEFTTLQLITTSAHPYEAGIADDVVALLQ
ncbi:MAG: hypothetical protein R8G66_31200 [Cytophagales bacterium]|nr:hypothetical protein [Cytophagales bacterium]